MRGRLRVAVPHTFGATHLGPVFAELARRHPRLQVHAAYADRFVDLLGEGFDAAVRVGYLQDSSLVARRIAPVRGKIVASPGYLEAHGTPMTPDDLIGHEALLQGTAPWKVVLDGKTFPVRVHGRYKADNGQALLAAALAGLGIGLLPDFLTDRYVASGELLPVLTGYPPLEAGLYVLRPTGDIPPRKVRALIDIMVERFGSGRRSDAADRRLRNPRQK